MTAPHEHSHDQSHAHGHGHSHDQSHGHGHSHSDAHDQPHAQSHDHAQAEILDLDATVLASHLAELIDWLPLEEDPRRVLDLGAGTGAGTLALLDSFPAASVTAIDSSAHHLERLREKAQTRGFAAQVTTVVADLDAEWPDLGSPDWGSPDLVWASASLHHLADPVRVLRAVRELMAVDGLIAVVELAGFPRFLPAGQPADCPGVEDRAHEAAERAFSAHLQHRGADWGPMLTEAGFRVEKHQAFALNVPASVDGIIIPSIGAYALGGLSRMREVVNDVLPAEDLAALDRLLDPEDPTSLLRRSDLVLTTERTAWAARPI